MAKRSSLPVEKKGTKEIDPIDVFARANRLSYAEAAERMQAIAVEEDRRDEERKGNKRTTTREKIKLAEKLVKSARGDKFKPKLDSIVRHAYYAVFHSHRDIFGGLSDSECYKLLASVSGMNRSSMHRLLNNECAEYGPVKREFARVGGGAEFDKQYLDPGTLERIEAAVAQWKPAEEQPRQRGRFTKLSSK